MARLSRHIAAPLAAGFLIWFSALTVAADQRAMILPVEPAPLVAETATGARSFTIEIADDNAEREAGLMFRETMADGHGMLFVFENTRQVGFWMKNTPMPLDLVFVGEDGRVKSIMPGESFSLTPIAPVMPVRFVLELKSGIADMNNLRVGDRLRHPAIDAIAGG